MAPVHRNVARSNINLPSSLPHHKHIYIYYYMYINTSDMNVSHIRCIPLCTQYNHSNIINTRTYAFYMYTTWICVQKTRVFRARTRDSVRVARWACAAQRSNAIRRASVEDSASAASGDVVRFCSGHVTEIRWDRQ
jgi:hypothetical protein